MSACRSCGAEIEWAESLKTGKNIPLDAKPTPDGNLVCIVGKVRGYTADDARLGRARRTSHFATCGQADMWRQE